MKKITALALVISFLTPFSVPGQKQSDSDKIINEKIKEALSHYVYTMWVLSNEPRRKAEKRSGSKEHRDDVYFKLFFDARQCRVEDMFVQSKVSRREAVTPEDLYYKKLSKDGHSRFKKIAFDFNRARLYREDPMPLDLQVLKSDVRLKDYLSEELLSNLARQPEGKYMYVKTFVVPQKFQGEHASDAESDVDSKDIIAIHWVYEKTPIHKLNYSHFKIMSWHSVQNSCDPCRHLGKADKDYYEEKDKPTFTPNDIELIRDSILYLVKTWQASDSATGGHAWALTPHIFSKGAIAVNPFSSNIVPRKVELPPNRDSGAVENRLYGRIEVGKERFSLPKNTFAIWATGSVNGLIRTDSGRVCSFKEPIPLRWQVSFEKNRNKLQHFRIVRVDFTDKYDHRKNWNCPNPAETTTPNDTLQAAATAFTVEMEKQVVEETQILLSFFSDMAAKKAVDTSRLYGMFEKGRASTIQVIGCETQILKTFPISAYRQQMDKERYAKKVLLPDFQSIVLKVSPDCTPSAQSCSGVVEFTHSFMGYDRKSAIDYADRTVKRMAVSIRKEPDGYRIKFGDIEIVSYAPLVLP